jgi:hypothetical protein
VALRTKLAGRGLLALAATLPLAAYASLPSTAAARPPIGERIGTAARAFLEALDDDQRAAAALPFDGAERTNWQFVPGIYPGVRIGTLDLSQRRLAWRLLETALSSQGSLKTAAIIELETFLREASERAGKLDERRDPERYAIAVFGSPDEGPFGFRFQGHHVSWNFTVISPDTVTSTPRFLGTNPHEVRSGPYLGRRVLGAEEDMARAFVLGLSKEQREKAILDEKVPADILTGPGRTADVLGTPKGIAFGDLDQPQKVQLLEILSESIRDLHPDLGRTELMRMRAPGYDGLHFAWIGSTDPGQPHYYRLHSPTLVLEYDNIQDGANHSHVVLHDLSAGFGGDLLRAHHEAAHGDAALRDPGRRDR